MDKTKKNQEREAYRAMFWTMLMAFIILLFITISINYENNKYNDLLVNSSNVSEELKINDSVIGNNTVDGTETLREMLLNNTKINETIVNNTINLTSNNISNLTN